MTTMTRRSSNPLSEMLTWLDTEAPVGLPGLGLLALVRMEDYVDDGTYVLRAELPGIDPDDDLDISVDGDVLTLSGERHEEQRDRNRHEMHYGSFSRSVRLPRHARAEDIAATYTAGVLEVRVPIDGPTEQPQKIAVRKTED